MVEHAQIQLRPIEIPDDEPFKNDQLARRDFVIAIASTLERTKGSAVFAVDGRWGSGKTIFARMLSCVLKQLQFRVVSINAWDTDYTDDPLGALTHALYTAVGSAGGWQEKIKKAGVALVRDAAIGTVRLATAGILNGEAVADLAEKRFDAFEKRTEAMLEFQDLLRRLAAEADKPLVVVVDELDRCRPTYAVEMLDRSSRHFLPSN